MAKKSCSGFAIHDPDGTLVLESHGAGFKSKQR
jgi:hypothetical protein